MSDYNTDDEIQVGDKVERLSPSWGDAVTGCVYEVEKILPPTPCSGTHLKLKGLTGSYEECMFKKVHQPKKIHPHHDIIIAWLGGADVRCIGNGSSWGTLYNIRTAKDYKFPHFYPDFEYEVVPENHNADEIEAIRKEMDKLSKRLKVLQEEV